jgi:hypothetical protein
MQLFPILVPSKGRATSSKLLQLLRKERVPFTVFCEPPEVKHYRAAGHQALAIGGVNRGVWYVRGWMHRYAQKQGIAWYWSIDDNVSAFYQRVGDQLVKKPVQEVLIKMQEEYASDSVVLFGPENRRLAWSAQGVGPDRKVYACFATRQDALVRYTPEVSLVEDVATTIQILQGGQHTILSYDYAYDKPSQGTTPGGNDWSGQGIEAKRLLAKENPGIVTLFEDKQGRVKLRVAWKKLGR